MLTEVSFQLSGILQDRKQYKLRGFFPYASYRLTWPTVNYISLNRLRSNIIQKVIPKTKKKLDNTASWLRSQREIFYVHQTDRMGWCSKGMETKAMHNVEESWIPREPDIRSSNAKVKKDDEEREICARWFQRTVQRPVCLSVCLFAHMSNFRNNKFLVPLCNLSSGLVPIPELPSSNLRCELYSRDVVFPSV